jgi:aryl sulfotransferase
MTTINQQGYWYLASYPKSGNTWCRVFITELQRLSALPEPDQLNLNRDLQTGTIASSRHWLDDQLGINCCDLSFAELDPIRGRAGESALLYSEGERFHKVHDAFVSPASKGRPIVNTQGCHGAVYILRHP